LQTTAGNERVQDINIPEKAVRSGVRSGDVTEVKKPAPTTRPRSPRPGAETDKRHCCEHLDIHVQNFFLCQACFAEQAL
jgi:hypothetical protein